MTDEQFFQTHPDRFTRIRLPLKQRYIDKQRAVSVADECESEFRSLGAHNQNRRRIVLYRVPPENPHYDPERPQILKIPLLLFADETVEDRDDILLPIIARIMDDARTKYN